MEIFLTKKLEKDIMEFVSLNNIENVNDFLVNCLNTGYLIAKYGKSPKDNVEKENKPFEMIDSTEKPKKTEKEEKPKKTIRIIKK